MVANSILWLVSLPLASSPLVYLIGRLAIRTRQGWVQINPARWLSVFALLVAGLPLIQSYTNFLASGPFSVSFGAIYLRLDGLSLLISATVLILGILVALFSGPYLSHQAGEEKYYALLVMLVGSIVGLSCAADLFNLWVWFEIMAISSFMLVAFHREQPGALEAGLKYLVQSAIGSTLVLLGISAVLGSVGSLDLAAIPKLASTSQFHPVLIAAGALFLVGFGIKAALVPLHTWLPDAHSQAPSGISAMLSGIVIEAGVVALLRSIAPLFGLATSWGPLFMGIGVLNMFVGNLLALRQVQVKRLLAFSSISQVGYMLLGLGIAITFNQFAGAQGALFHLVNHAFMKSLAFLSAGVLLYGLYISHGHHGSLAIADLSGAARRYPWVAFTFSIALLALGGLPPFSGFMSKWQIFLAGFQVKNVWAIAAVIFAALNSVLSLGYYAPLVNAMYRQQPSNLVESGSQIPWTMLLPLVLLSVAVVVLGIKPDLLNSFTLQAAQAIFSNFGG